MTATLTLHEPLGGITPPARPMLASPLAGAKLPLQVLLAFGVVATLRFAGNASVNAAPVSATRFGFVSTSVSVETPEVVMLAGANDLAIVGFSSTCSVAVLLAAPALPLSVDAAPPDVLL